MKGKKYFLSAIILGMLLSVSGCGSSFPEMTEEEYNQTVEFAVGVLMKHSNNEQSKLTYVDAKEEQKQRDKEKRAAEKEAQKSAAEASTKASTQTPTHTDNNSSVISTTQQTEPDENILTGDDIASTGSNAASVPDESMTGDSENSAASASDASEADATTEAISETTESSSDTNTEETPEVNPNAIILSDEYSQEVLDKIFLSYQGYSISSTYPESSKSYVINADKGKKLLVLRFDLYNAANSDQKINLIQKNILIQILLNGKNLGYTAVTFLPNDLTSFVGTIESKTHESLVALTEIDESLSRNIQTLGMKVSINGIEQEVSLQ